MPKVFDCPQNLLCIIKCILFFMILCFIRLINVLRRKKLNRLFLKQKLKNKNSAATPGTSVIHNLNEILVNCYSPLGAVCTRICACAEKRIAEPLSVTTKKTSIEIFKKFVTIQNYNSPVLYRHPTRDGYGI